MKLRELLKYLAPIITALSITPELMATNGLKPIGVSAGSRALGGTGIANFTNGYDALYKNPALLSSPLNKWDRSLTGAMILATFDGKARPTYGNDQSYRSPESPSEGFFPGALGLTLKYDEDISLAAGFYGGGGGADFGDDEGVLGAKSSTQAFSLVQGGSYKVSDKTAIGAAIHASAVQAEASSLNFSTKEREYTKGKAIIPGFAFGVAHYMRDDLVLGFNYASAQTARLKEARDFEPDGELDNVEFTAIPTELALGISWVTGRFTLTSDVKYLQWSKARFLKTLGWKDQQVAALGVQFKEGKHALRIGYNAATSPVKNVEGESGYDLVNFQGHDVYSLVVSAISGLSGIGLTTEHYTLGTAHQLSDTLTLATGLVHFKEATSSRTGEQKFRARAPKPYGWRYKLSATTLNLELSAAI